MLLSTIILFQNFLFSNFIKLLLHYNFQSVLIGFINIFLLFSRFSISNKDEIIIINFKESMITSKILNKWIKRIIILKTLNKVLDQVLSYFFKLLIVVFLFLNKNTCILIFLKMIFQNMHASFRSLHIFNLLFFCMHLFRFHYLPTYDF